MTRQRRIILEVVCASPHEHLSADEVYERVRRRLPRVSLATVYRNLDVLANQGRIRRIGACDPHMRFDGCLDVHFHLRCARCGGLEDAPVNPCSALDKAVREMSTLGVFDYRLEFLHVCADCRRAGTGGRGRTGAGKTASARGPGKTRTAKSGTPGVRGVKTKKSVRAKGAGSRGARFRGSRR